MKTCPIKPNKRALELNLSELALINVQKLESLRYLPLALIQTLTLTNQDTDFLSHMLFDMTLMQILPCLTSLAALTIDDLLYSSSPPPYL